MECTTPPALTDEELSAALDGEVDAAVQQHLAQCPACAARFAEMRQMDMLFHSLRRIECPSPQQLADFHFGFLDQSTALLVEQHLETCPRCKDEFEYLQEFEKLDIKEPVVNPIIPLWDTDNTYRATRVDTSGNLALLRGKDDKADHDVQAGSARVFLETTSTPKGYLLSGQVVDSEVSWGSGVAEFWQDKTLQQVGVLDEMSEFHFEFTMAVPINLYITAPSGITLAIEDIQIQT